jgi:transposase InsO family protein
VTLTWDGWAYLATVIDLHSRKLIGWAIADHMRTALITEALAMAIKTAGHQPGLFSTQIMPRLSQFRAGAAACDW